jgi:heme exporter protein D
MTGMIQGGWEYVWSAYGLTAAVFVLYAVSMQLRLRREPE